MLPLYRPGTVPKPPPFQIGNVQRRVIHHLSPVVPSSSTTTILDSPREEPLLMSGATTTTTSGNRKNIIFWIVGAILVFWVILVTLFFISHLAGSRHSIPTTTTSVATIAQNFALLPIQKHFLNVSLLPMTTSTLLWHRTCCWQEQVLHCDGNGMFSTHVEKDMLVVQIIQMEIIGASCTFYGFQ